jgi:translation initiation factor 3 subunit B
VHRQGVALWGGPGFARFAKFSHNGVQFIEFSPCERYLASGSTHDPANAREQAQVVVNFFDVRSGAKLRSFQVSFYLYLHLYFYFRISVFPCLCGQLY